MNDTFACPQCGASLQYSGGGQSMHCPYCGSNVQVPQELWRPAEEAKTALQWQKYVVWFLILTVGLPTCLGLLGTVLGVGGGVLAAVLPFVLHIVAR
jgi:hypothetical protein